jgi:hypothetical protein
MDIISQILDSLLNGKNSNRNIAITVVLVILFGLNLLGVDINYLSKFSYSITTLIIINIIIFIILCGILLSKLNSIYVLGLKFDENAKNTEKLKEDIDILDSQTETLINNQNSIINICKLLMEELNGMPNIKFMYLMIELKMNSIWYEIFKECLTYSLMVNENSQKVVLENFKDNIEDIKKAFSIFMKQIIKKYSINENLSNILNTKLDEKMTTIISELQKDKKINEKLYVISLLIKQLEDEMNIEINAYLQNAQNEILLQN